jgi:cold shock CspA family protein
MNSGRIKWFNPYQSYGYILTLEGAEVYFQATSIAESRFIGHLGPGQSVSFDLVETRLGFEACNILPNQGVYL